MHPKRAIRIPARGPVRPIPVGSYHWYEFTPLRAGIIATLVSVVGLALAVLLS